MRWAMVGSGVRKARAISSVVRPLRRRRARAARDSVGMMGWQTEQEKQRKEQAIANATGLRVLAAVSPPFRFA
jgi:hypothetical protein